jgi:hypothetical protein
MMSAKLLSIFLNWRMPTHRKSRNDGARSRAGDATTMLLHTAHPSMSLMQIDLGLDSDVLRGPIGDCGHGRRGVWRPQLREPNA